MVFFFSSRRRHTRYWRDWSSDVCSSDPKLRRFGYSRPYRSELSKLAAERPPILAPRGPLPLTGGRAPHMARGDRATVESSTSPSGRSEERRVGKECRAGGAPVREERTGI